MKPLALGFRMERRSKTASNGTISKAVCPDCGERLANPRMIAEEVAHRDSDGHVHAAQRIFYGDCPTHGFRRVDHMGHHTTMNEKALKARYAGAQGRITKALLAPDEKRFTEALHGRCMSSDEELGRWDQIRDAEQQGEWWRLT